MYLLVHVGNNRELASELTSRINAEHGLTVTMCDNISKVCPKCSEPKGDHSTVSTTTVTQSSDIHRHEEQKIPSKLLPQSAPKLFSQNVAKLVTSTSPQKAAPIHLKTMMPTNQRPAPTLTKVLPLPPKPMPIPLRVAPGPVSKITPSRPTMNGHHHQSNQTPVTTTTTTTPMVVVKRKEPLVLPEKVPEVKKIKMEMVAPKIKEEEIIFDDDLDAAGCTFFDNVMKQLQDGVHKFKQSPGDSDDGASISSNIYDGDDDDSKNFFNPEFLTNFITSQPVIFNATTQESSRSQVDSQPLGTNVKRVVPPMLTVNGKTRRGRIVYTPQELDVLEKYYEQDPNACADPAKREKMCNSLSIDYHRLKVWFQNRRRKDKVKSQEDPTSSFNGLDFLDCDMKIDSESSN